VGLKPRDHRAWSLLAHCLRKKGKWREAAAAYREVIAIAPEAQANRARFKAGVVLQDKLGRHREAIVTFDEYLEMAGAKSLEVEAKIRLARSYSAIGDKGRARKILEDVVSHHGGAAGAAKAKQMLVKINED
ncbi:MAG: tetratricopeptide repeat protein, partial [Deltaproteobacteria bacterium]|nr:tetratricopeptide repeat protein [Deltaproteobacteria bacterium]